MNKLIFTVGIDPAISGERRETHDCRADVDTLRLIIATYLLGQMMPLSTEKINGDAKELKVKAAFRYADLLLKG